MKQTNRTVEQRLRRCTIIKSYESLALQELLEKMLDVSRAVGIGDPNEAVKTIDKICKESARRMSDIFKERDAEVAKYDEQCEEWNTAPEKYERIRASGLIMGLIKLIAEHGDLPVTSGAQFLGEPRFDICGNDEPTFEL